MATTPVYPLDLEAQTDYALGNAPKVIYAGDSMDSDGNNGNGQPYLFVGEDYCSLVGDDRHVLTVSPEFGISLTGEMAFSAMPDQISIGGGYWRINPLVLSCLPSTTATPIPWLIPSTPQLMQGSAAIASAVQAAESALGI